MMNNVEYVKEKWDQLTAFSKKEDLKERLWQEVLYYYSAANRYYHNLNHIAHIFTWCDKFISHIQNPAVVGFAVIYHDIVYDTYRDDNEELSAQLAEKHLGQLHLNPSLIKSVRRFIFATRDHKIPDDVEQVSDLCLFLDFDKAILGVDEDMYKLYSKKIRQEYAKYPDHTYREGRKQALKKMLSSGPVFHTPQLNTELEDKARKNMNEEISSLA